MRRVWSTGGLGMLLCVVGCALVFFPWAEVQIVTFDPAAPQVPPPKGSLVHEQLRGYQLWGGVASAAAFLGGLLLLVITGPLQPTPAWRSTALLACGLAASGAAVALMAFPPEPLKRSAEAGRMVMAYAWGYPHLLSMVCSGMLVLLAAVELRGWVGRRLLKRGEPSTHNAAAPGAGTTRSR
jgi:hypothetical protein